MVSRSPEQRDGSRAGPVTAPLEARRLAKTFGPNVALADLSLQVAAGEIFCLLGANGAGKSTTINLFLGFLQPTSGQALVSGIDAVRDPKKALRRLAYIPEQVALYPELTGLENLEHFTRLSGAKRTRDEQIALLNRTGLDQDQASRRAAEYSKGMRQKVGIAIALGKDADALLLDEPLSGLDPSAANTFCDLLMQFKAGGKAVLMATHDIFRAKSVGDRVGIMRAGRLVDVLDTKAVDAVQLEQVYLAHMAAAGRALA